MKHATYILILFASYHIQCALTPYVDLDQGQQQFILETKRIEIPGFPGAFNASIALWKDAYLMCFRVRNAAMVSTFQIGIVLLDRSFKPINKAQILEIRHDTASYAHYQDPRLIELNNTIYLIYSNEIHDGNMVTRRMFIAPLQHENNIFFIENPVCLHAFEGASKRWEKNWVPFTYHNNLFLSYSLLPHRILKPENLGFCTTESSTYSEINWQWGELRGGTPAIRIDEGYLAFFHSSKVMASQQSEGKKIQHYFIGAYLFSDQPPFSITHVSAEPLKHKSFYNGTMYNTWKPLRVVFPMGLLVEDDYIYITYGRQDFEIWIAQIDKKELLASLVTCPLITAQQGAALVYSQKQIDGITTDDNYYETCC